MMVGKYKLQISITHVEVPDQKFDLMFYNSTYIKKKKNRKRIHPKEII